MPFHTIDKSFLNVYVIPVYCESSLTSGVGVRFGLVVLSSVIWNPGDDNNSVVVVDKGFIVGRRNRRASADGGSGCDRGASAGIDQGLDFGGILEF